MGDVLAMQLRRLMQSHSPFCSQLAQGRQPASFKMALTNNAFWLFADSIFAELSTEDGVEENNLFWLRYPDELTEEKLIMKVSSIVMKMWLGPIIICLCRCSVHSKGWQGLFMP